MNHKRRVFSGALVALEAASSASTAHASHKHANSLATDSASFSPKPRARKASTCPAVFGHNPNVSVASSPGRNHPLHVLVHRAVAGQSGDYYVYGSLEARTACNADYVNR